MRRIVAFVSIIAFLFILSPAHAETPVKKLGRGMANIVTCPIEIPYRMSEANNKYGPIVGVYWGILNGIFRMGTRAVVGIYEILTFPLNIPKDYGPVIDDPEYFLDMDFYYMT